MQFREFQTKPGFDRDGKHIIIKPDPHDPHDPHPAPSVAVPEGGSTLLFVLAALTAIGWAVSKRYAAKCMCLRAR
jgi:hypothetical protein